MKVIAIAVMLVCWFAGYDMGKRQADGKAAEAFNAGAKHALYHRPVSDELELVCAGLWVAEQHRIYNERELHEQTR